MGFVLAGGKSSRMGTDKAFLQFRGRTMLDRALETLQAVCPAAAIVGDPAAFAAYRNIIPDVFPGCGPLGGIHAALSSTASELNVILAVDMPFVSRELLSYLVDAAESSSALVTVPRTSRGFQPTCAVYHHDFLSAAEQALRKGKYKIDALFSQVEVQLVGANELSAAGFSEKNFFNVNTPEEMKDIVDC